MPKLSTLCITGKLDLAAKLIGNRIPSHNVFYSCISSINTVCCTIYYVLTKLPMIMARSHTERQRLRQRQPRQWRIWGMRAHPLWPKMFSISCSFFGKFGKIIYWRPLPSGLAPLPMRNPGSLTSRKLGLIKIELFDLNI